MNAYCFACCIALAVTTFCPTVGATDPPSGTDKQNVLPTFAAAQTRAPTAKPIEIDSGFVIFEGRYVPPPYVVQSEQGTVYINGLKVPETHRAQFARRSIGMRRAGQMLLKRGAARIEQHLCNDGMLICIQNGPTAFVPVQQAVLVLDVLLSDEPGNTKTKRLLQVHSSGITSEQWASLVESFDAPTEFRDRVLALKQRRADLGQSDGDDRWYRTFLSGITIAGFVLAVWALGTLLGCRPPAMRGWRETDRSRASSYQVIYLVVLIVVLNFYDLICTLFAQGIGGLWELNPFAGHMAEFAPMIVTFKLALTIGAAILLLATRYHRLAQIGSWWAGVLYSVLILRWITFNSVIL
jgi:hypothetical protein